MREIQGHLAELYGTEVSPDLISRVTDAVLDEVRDEMEARRVTLEAAAAPDVRLPLNRARLVHVFFNLFNNAADFLKNGGKSMIRFEETSRDVHVEVEDTGPGIPPEVARKLFTPFFTHGKPNGTGLGLTIARQRIVEQHHHHRIADPVAHADDGGDHDQRWQAVGPAEREKTHEGDRTVTQKMMDLKNAYV